jgi:hypothetical protein
MADLLEQASAWLQDQRTRHLTRTVTYRRGASSSLVAATVGKTVFDLDDGGGAVLRVESRDYLILAADLSQGTPQAGDRIVDQGVVYEVANFGSEPAWRYSDPYRRTLRIHTKQVDLEASP